MDGEIDVCMGAAVILCVVGLPSWQAESSHCELN